ncbi:MAG TPA: hypothetical protein VOB72_03170 [Candidatus Dormibacteraeota bacterium]|nr:hypothetical protein [Candidatus Dormibacteraeota bacterium]
MRKHILWASASLALIVACGGSSSPPSAGSGSGSCVNGQAAHHAYVVVEHLSGKVVQGCVGFAGAQITGDDLMSKSGIKYNAQTFTGLGKAICQLDGEPATFTECFPKDKPYWALVVSTAGGPWADAQSGYATTDLKDGDALGWQYRQPTGSPPPLPMPRK